MDTKQHFLPKILIFMYSISSSFDRETKGTGHFPNKRNSKTMPKYYSSIFLISLKSLIKFKAMMLF